MREKYFKSSCIVTLFVIGCVTVSSLLPHQCRAEPLTIQVTSDKDTEEAGVLVWIRDSSAQAKDSPETSPEEMPEVAIVFAKQTSIPVIVAPSQPIRFRISPASETTGGAIGHTSLKNGTWDVSLTEDPAGIVRSFAKADTPFWVVLRPAGYKQLVHVSQPGFSAITDKDGTARFESLVPPLSIGLADGTRGAMGRFGYSEGKAKVLSGNFSVWAEGDSVKVVIGQEQKLPLPRGSREALEPTNK